MSQPLEVVRDEATPAPAILPAVREAEAAVAAEEEETEENVGV
jgi:hypothetical protein